VLLWEEKRRYLGTSDVTEFRYYPARAGARCALPPSPTCKFARLELLMQS